MVVCRRFRNSNWFALDSHGQIELSEDKILAAFGR